MLENGRISFQALKSWLKTVCEWSILVLVVFTRVMGLVWDILLLDLCLLGRSVPLRDLHEFLAGKEEKKVGVVCRSGSWCSGNELGLFLVCSHALCSWRFVCSHSPFIVLVVGFQLGVEANKCVHFINPIGSFNRGQASYITTKRTSACSCMTLGNYSWLGS